MILKLFLAIISWHISVGKEKSGGPKISDSLGGIYVIFFGDFHQLPPVACVASKALYVLPVEYGHRHYGFTAWTCHLQRI